MGVCGQYVLMQTLFMNRIEDFMKKIFRQIHLWLSVPFGLIISLICFSGAFHPEFQSSVHPTNGK